MPIAGRKRLNGSCKASAAFRQASSQWAVPGSCRHGRRCPPACAACGLRPGRPRAARAPSRPARRARTRAGRPSELAVDGRHGTALVVRTVISPPMPRTRPVASRLGPAHRPPAPASVMLSTWPGRSRVTGPVAVSSLARTSRYRVAAAPACPVAEVAP